MAIEVKSCRTDFLTDRKWRDYLDYADQFYFAVAPDFPVEMLPEGEGLILADRYAASLIRPSQARAASPPAAARSLLLRFARTAALRLQGAADPIGRGRARLAALGQPFLDQEAGDAVTVGQAHRAPARVGDLGAVEPSRILDLVLVRA